MPSVTYNADGDSQKSLDVIADAKFLEAVKESGMAAAYVSEEQEGAIVLDRDAPLVVAIDPLDGSSNIDVNVSIGTIISVLPNSGVDPHGISHAAGRPTTGGRVLCVWPADHFISYYRAGNRLLSDGSCERAFYSG